jgi:hypothetical protein
MAIANLAAWRDRRREKRAARHGETVGAEPMATPAE